MATSETKIAGLHELLKGLQRLPEDLGRKEVWAALGGAAAEVRREAIALGPELDSQDPAVIAGRRRPGTLKKAIRASRSRINKGQAGLYEMIVRVKPLKGKKKAQFKSETGKGRHLNPDDPYYWWWVEFGTEKMAKRPFMRPAFENTKDAQLERMRKRMKAAIERAARAIKQEVDGARR